MTSYKKLCLAHLVHDRDVEDINLWPGRGFMANREDMYFICKVMACKSRESVCGGRELQNTRNGLCYKSKGKLFKKK